MESLLMNGASESTEQSVAGCFVQMGWMLGGTMVLATLAILIARETTWTFTLKDAAYWALVFLVMALRFLDMKYFTPPLGPIRTLGRAAFARFVLISFGIWTPTWVLVQSIDLT